MDDGKGVAITRKQQVGTIFGTEDVLLRAIQLGQISSRSDAKLAWEKLRRFDELLRFEDTKLSDKRLYFRQ